MECNSKDEAAECHDLRGRFICQCSPAFTGKFCDMSTVLQFWLNYCSIKIRSTELDRTCRLFFLPSTFPLHYLGHIATRALVPEGLKGHLLLVAINRKLHLYPLQFKLSSINLSSQRERWKRTILVVRWISGENVSYVPDDTASMCLTVSWNRLFLDCTYPEKTEVYWT